MPGTTSRSGRTSITEVQDPPTHHNTSPEISPCRVTALSRDTICSSTIYSRPSSTVTTSVLSGGISSTLPPPAITSSTHYHAVVCNSATCLGDRVITTPSPTSQDITPHASSLSPPRQMASRPEQGNQAPREHTQPPPAQLVSREELHSALANMFHNLQNMFTSLLSQNKEETAMPSNAQHPNMSRHNQPSCLSCQCDSLPKEQSPTSSAAPENTITTRLHQEKMLQKLIRAPEVKFDGKDSQDYGPWKRALQKNRKPQPNF